MGQSRRTFTDEFKAAAVGRLYKPGATQGGVAKELGVTSSQFPADLLDRLVRHWPRTNGGSIPQS
ncbi:MULTISPECIES: transposase [unclassified Leisingera]|uniref:transposase n=1 Tax=unclassified Leisingera TaxID=2614906 RepID=UPI0009DFFE4F|nr:MULTISPECIES: transposase [unclassified Leisingera]